MQYIAVSQHTQTHTERDLLLFQTVFLGRSCSMKPSTPCLPFSSSFLPCLLPDRPLSLSFFRSFFRCEILVTVSASFFQLRLHQNSSSPHQTHASPPANLMLHACRIWHRLGIWLYWKAVDFKSVHCVSVLTNVLFVPWTLATTLWIKVYYLIIIVYSSSLCCVWLGLIWFGPNLYYTAVHVCTVLLQVY